MTPGVRYSGVASDFGPGKARKWGGDPYGGFREKPNATAIDMDSQLAKRMPSAGPRRGSTTSFWHVSRKKADSFASAHARGNDRASVSSHVSGEFRG